MKELYLKAQNENRFLFSRFLNSEEISELLSIFPKNSALTLFGGTQDCERLVARFGNARELGYEQDFPIVCIALTPLNIKFADAFSHRDVLGALMNLGIERSLIGDIVIKDNSVFVFALEGAADYIAENLTKIRHTDVQAELCAAVPDSAAANTEPIELIVSSLRADCVTAAAFNFSRTASADLFEMKRIFINSAQAKNGSAILKPGDRVSVRGVGKFVFSGEKGVTKKGRLIIVIEKYI